MKFDIAFKSPDAVFYAVQSEVEHLQPTEAERKEFEDMGHEDPTAAWRDAKIEELTEFVAKWVYYGEGVTIEFDTETGTAAVETVK